MDTDLVRSAMRGDERAFAEIVNSITDRFLGVAPRILRDASLAEDAVQQALLGAWRDLPDLRDPANFEGWSYRLLVHACYMEARKRKRWHPQTVVRSLAEPTASDLIGGVIERERLERGFERLSVDHRTVLVLTYYMDLPSEQVAEALDVPEVTTAMDQPGSSRRPANSITSGATPSTEDVGRAPLDPSWAPFLVCATGPAAPTSWRWSLVRLPIVTPGSAKARSTTLGRWPA